jgi:hypothetical protein
MSRQPIRSSGSGQWARDQPVVCLLGPPACGPACRREVAAPAGLGDRRRWRALQDLIDHGGEGLGPLALQTAVPPAGADTEYADLRAAYDALPDATKAQIADLKAHHSIAYSRQVLGFEFSAQEEEALRGAIHPVVRTLPRTHRRSLYVASHASRIIDWPLPEGRLLLRDLIEHATQRQFVYRHAWHEGDLVIWDNRCTMHRATPFEDARYRRELRRVTTLDVPEPALVATPA